jgi:hypothetical protein
VRHSGETIVMMLVSDLKADTLFNLDDAEPPCHVARDNSPQSSCFGLELGFAKWTQPIHDIT